MLFRSVITFVLSHKSTINPLTPFPKIFLYFNLRQSKNHFLNPTNHHHPKIPTFRDELVVPRLRVVLSSYSRVDAWSRAVSDEIAVQMRDPTQVPSTKQGSVSQARSTIIRICHLYYIRPRYALLNYVLSYQA